MGDLHEYYQNLMADIRREADASGILMVEAFFDRMADRLMESGELEVAERAFYEVGNGNQLMRLDGYTGDPRDSGGVLGLIACDFVDSDDIKTFGKSDIPPLLNPLIRFLKRARSPDFRDSLNEATPGFQVSDLIIATWPHVEKVKLILISNRSYIGRDDAVKLQELDGIPVTWSVWDLARFERFDRSGQAREDMVIDFAADFGAPLPAIKASIEEAALESYLAIIPGSQLAAIYDRWGARLLEANVRSFLQARGKTNKGIQKTIKEEPDRFFPYNNGISATADGVTCIRKPEGIFIESINNLQIVNGAQTTGTIHSALKSAKEQLDRVFVQMKLTVVPDELSESVVPKISEFANTQNKVSAADFFSNHPFHVRMENFSRTVLFAAKEGERHDTKWFYERSRGQYLNARGRLTATQQKKFDIEFPRSHIFSKTDLAKLVYSADGKPHVVSRGAQKNFAEFAKDIGDSWSKNDADYDELWYRRLIAKAIIFRRLEEEVPKQSWYEGGYRANIVTYAMAKVFHDAGRENNVLDLDVIWKRQNVSAPLLRAIMVAAKAANEVITHPPSGVRNMSEWAKLQGCWSLLKGQTLDYGKEFEGCLILRDISRANEKDQKKKDRDMSGISAQTLVVDRGANFWKMVLEKGTSNHLLSPKDQQILLVCASMPRKVPSELQAKYAIRLLEQMEEQGLLNPSESA